MYEKTYPYKCSKKHIHIPDCLCKSTANRLNASSVLNCKEHVKLLRPERYVLNWQREKHLNGFVSLTIPEFGIDHAHASIVSIRACSRKQIPVMSEGSRPVTGLFVRHALNVRKYTFTNLQTGQPGTINATPEHRFYVKNLQTFIPVAEIAGTDKLITDTGESVQLSCRENSQKYCGEPLHAREPVPVYNLEVAHRHAYFAGSLHILVHNTYVITRYPSGGIRYLGEMKDNQCHGTGTLYDQNRKRVYKGQWKNGLAHGNGTRFHENGKKEYKGQWIKGVHEGRGKLYNTEGLKVYDGDWVNHTRHGWGIGYDRNNQSVSKGKWRHGQFLRGICLKYDTEGNIIERRKYDNTPTYAAAFFEWYKER